MEGEWVRPLYGQGRYGIVPPKAPCIIAICVMQIRLSHHTIIILGDSNQILPASKSREMTTAEASLIGPFSLGKGRFDLFIREKHVHLLQPLVLDGSGRQEWRMRAIWFECVVGFSLCSTQFNLVVS